LKYCEANCFIAVSVASAAVLSIFSIAIKKEERVDPKSGSTREEDPPALYPLELGERNTLRGKSFDSLERAFDASHAQNFRDLAVGLSYSEALSGTSALKRRLVGSHPDDPHSRVTAVHA
jgi:hypothetical protein